MALCPDCPPIDGSCAVCPRTSQTVDVPPSTAEQVRGVEFTARLRLTDFGPWQPDNPVEAAALIAVINDHRRPQDGKPRITVWSGRRCLWGSIDADSFALDPGEHLVRNVLPDGSEQWGALPVEMLASLRARAEAVTGEGEARG